MPFIKYASAKIAQAFNGNSVLDYYPEFEKRLASISPIKLDPERYFYVRDRICSAYEVHGLNSNFDGFPRNELMLKYKTFIGSRLSVDHKDTLIIGYVPDSLYIPSVYEKNGNIKVRGDFVENILACDKKQTDKIGNMMGISHLSEKILSGEITDVSMGCMANYTECTVCGKLAYKPEDFCEHLNPDNKMKGANLKLASGEEKVIGELCHEFGFFEDAIIVPLHLGGLAGGRGADTSAKLLEHIASTNDEFPLGTYIIKKAGDTWTPSSIPTFNQGESPGGLSQSQSQGVQMGDKPTDIQEGENDEYKRQKDKSDEEEDKKIVIQSDIEEDKTADVKIAEDAFTQLQELTKQGVKIPEAIERIKKIYEKPYQEALTSQAKKSSIALELKKMSEDFGKLISKEGA